MAKVNWHEPYPTTSFSFVAKNPSPTTPSGGSTIFMFELLIFCVLN
jgi:hypothetical protein